jgi:hypothetical protein
MGDRLRRNLNTNIGSVTNIEFLHNIIFLKKANAKKKMRRKAEVFKIFRSFRFSATSAFLFRVLKNHRSKITVDWIFKIVIIRNLLILLCRNRYKKQTLNKKN